MSTEDLFAQRTGLVENFFAALGGIVLTINGEEQPPQFIEDDGWQAVVAVPGLQIMPIMVPGHTGSDYLHSRGPAGTQMQNGEVPQSCRFTVIEGAIWWRQQHRNNGEYFRLEAGHTATLEPHEKHSYVFLEDCFNMTVVTPPFSHHTPRPIEC